jgi:hypothetical protein
MPDQDEAVLLQVRCRPRAEKQVGHGRRDQRADLPEHVFDMRQRLGQNDRVGERDPRCSAYTGIAGAPVLLPGHLALREISFVAISGPALPPCPDPTWLRLVAHRGDHRPWCPSADL